MVVNALFFFSQYINFLMIFNTLLLLLGDVILEEKPLVSSQFSWNKSYNYTACEYCMKSIEHAQNMARRLSTKYDLELPYLEQCCDIVRQTSNFVQCPQCKVRIITLFDINVNNNLLIF